MKLLSFVVSLLLSLLVSSNTYAVNIAPNSAKNLTEGASSKFESYLPLIKNKRVAVFANNASQVDSKNIVTALTEHNINIVKIFSPEHGFNGQSDAGAAIRNESTNNIPIVSLYGKKDKPDAQDLSNVDVIIFDIQDVGVRYYTYISSLQKLMEAAVDNNKPLIVLDRPNPNGYYIDGPVLEIKYKSFVGMQRIPLVYGMTIGEYAKMLVGEEWLDLTPKSKAKKLRLTVIPLTNYTHNTHVTINERPSPNLPNMTAIYWYPTLGWFEGTKLSIGRGTPMPFQVLGHPDYKSYESSFKFTPIPMPGALNPPLKNQECYGWDFQMSANDALNHINGQIQVHYLLTAYQYYPDKAHFFTSFFARLAGTDRLRQQVTAGWTESQIRASWQPQLKQFKKIRAKYLLYP